VLLQAVCCSDKLHCCPNSYTCDLSSGTCNKDQHSMSWNAMTVRSKKPSAREVDCPGSQQTCPDENTCCKLQSGTYACCPEPQVRLLSPPLTVICWYFRATCFTTAAWNFIPTPQKYPVGSHVKHGNTTVTEWESEDPFLKCFDTALCFCGCWRICRDCQLPHAYTISYCFELWPVRCVSFVKLKTCLQQFTLQNRMLVSVRMCTSQQIMMYYYDRSSFLWTQVDL